MRKAIWFSRHEPTAEQLATIREMGYFLTQEDIKEGMELGAEDCSSKEDALEVREWLRSKRYGLTRVFGVFPVAIRALAFTTILERVEYDQFALYESVNDTRPIEGGKPTFKFLRWEWTGVL